MHTVNTLSMAPEKKVFRIAGETLNFLSCADGTVFVFELCLNVCSPSQVLGDVYTEVLEAVHPLHRGPTDHKRSVGPLLSLPEVYNQLFSFAHVQRETVVLAQ